MSGVNFLTHLLITSEKAASIARTCRKNDRLRSLLIQEKGALTKNACFVADFKTLADVLIQELVRYDLERQFPSLKGFIYGEEESVFTNTLGETVTLVLNDDKSNTVALLTKVLNGDVEAANSLSDSVHEDLLLKDVPVLSLPVEVPDLNFEDLALWIDPIDATTEYINGQMSKSEGLPCGGLKCVTVLIGVFSKASGLPVVGVINKPFHNFNDSNSVWKGHCYWGFSQNGFHASSIPMIEIPSRKPVIAVSSYEDECVRKKLQDAGYNLVSLPGAGNKCLCVILGLVDAYVLSQDSTYYWDTCGGHALLKSVQGNMWNYHDAIKTNFTDLRYQKKCSSLDVKEYSNKCGLIAFRNEKLAREIVSILQ